MVLLQAVTQYHQMSANRYLVFLTLNPLIPDLIALLLHDIISEFGGSGWQPPTLPEARGWTGLCFPGSFPIGCFTCTGVLRECLKKHCGVGATLDTDAGKGGAQCAHGLGARTGSRGQMALQVRATAIMHSSCCGVLSTLS